MDSEISRPDGRSPNQIRPLACSRGVLHRAHGSARWSQENTIVLAAVYGPKPASGKKENAEKATLEVIWKPKMGQAGKAEKELELNLKRTLDYIFLSTMNPNTITSIILQVQVVSPKSDRDKKLYRGLEDRVVACIMQHEDIH